jgi:hypothetical protein
MSKLNARIGIFSDSKNVDTYVDIFNLENKISVPSIKWDDMMNNLKNNEEGTIQISKKFNDKPAKSLAWIKKENSIVIETYTSTDDENWDFEYEFVLSNEKLEKFIPIYEYNINIMNELKLEFKKDAPVLKRNK